MILLATRIALCLLREKKILRRVPGRRGPSFSFACHPCAPSPITYPAWDGGARRVKNSGGGDDSGGSGGVAVVTMIVGGGGERNDR